MYLGCVSCGLAGPMTEAEINDRHTFLARQLHAVALAIVQAKDRGDIEGVKNLLPRFELIAAEYRALGNHDLTAMDNFVLRTGQWVSDSSAAAGKLLTDAATAVGKAAGGAVTPLLVPLLVVGGLLLAAKGKGLI